MPLSSPLVRRKLSLEALEDRTTPTFADPAFDADTTNLDLANHLEKRLEGEKRGHDAAHGKSLLEAEAFGRVIRKEEKHVWGIEDAIQSMKIIDAFFKAGKTGKWEKV